MVSISGGPQPIAVGFKGCLPPPQAGAGVQDCGTVSDLAAQALQTGTFDTERLGLHVRAG